MKNMVLNVRVCAVIFAIAGHLVIAPLASAMPNRSAEITQVKQQFRNLNEQQAHVVAIVEEFVDFNRNPGKKPREFVDELKHVLLNNPADKARYQPVCNKLDDLLNKNVKNAVRFASEFKAFENLLAVEVRQALEAMKARKGLSKPQLLDIFKKRLNA